MLIDQLPGKAKFSGVKSISFTEGNLFKKLDRSEPIAVATQSKTVQEVTERTFDDRKLNSIVKSMVSKILKDQRGGDAFRDILHPDDIEVKVQIVCKNLKKGESEPLLDEMAEVFRHAEGIDAKVGLSGGGSWTPEKYRVTKLQSVQCIAGIPDHLDLFTKMGEWLDHLLETGKVSAE
jgi:hypothetical protein